MMLYASDERRAEMQTYAGNPVPLRLASSMMPRVYTVRSLATSPDGTRARMRATGNFTFMGSTAPSFGVIDMVREAGGWKVDKFEWTGDKPAGFDGAVAQSPVRRGATGGLEKAPAEPIAVEPKPAPPETIPLAGEPPRPAPAKSQAVPPERAVQTSSPVVASPAPGMIERSRNRVPCEIKPVMTDEDLLNCGASPR